MYKVVIADDEHFILKELETIIDWNKFGCTVTGLAKNGNEAKELVIKTQAEILITDIKMPGLDGLELIGELYESINSIHFILISGFSDFSYALAGIKYGVSDYLLKPIDKQELEKALLKIIEADHEQTEESCPDQDLRLQSQCNRYIKSAYEYVEQHYTEQFSLQDMADWMGISYSYLSKLFVGKLKMRFTKFVNLYRVKISQQYLNSTEKTIEEIAELVGYNDYKYFSQVFKSLTGMTPIQYKHEKKYFINS